MKQKQAPITSVQAIDEYYGGLAKLNASRLPFRCKYGCQIWRADELLKHVRVGHKEKIIKL